MNKEISMIAKFNGKYRISKKKKQFQMILKQEIFMKGENLKWNKKS